MGTTQEVSSALTLKQSLNNETVKSAVLHAYGFASAYQQKICKHAKAAAKHMLNLHVKISFI